MHAIVQRLGMSEVWAYAEHFLSGTKRVQLSSESSIKINRPDFLMKEEKNDLVLLVAIVKEAMWKTK